MKNVCYQVEIPTDTETVLAFLMLCHREGIGAGTVLNEAIKSIVASGSLPDAVQGQSVETFGGWIERSGILAQAEEALRSPRPDAFRQILSMYEEARPDADRLTEEEAREALWDYLGALDSIRADVGTAQSLGGEVGTRGLMGRRSFERLSMAMEKADATGSELSSLIGISLSAFYDKALRVVDEFNLDEVETISHRLKLTPDQVGHIFFDMP